LRTLKTGEAAALLHVTTNTLRTWERRFGYPNPQRLPSKHRVYAYAEIVALQEALDEGLTISSAVSVAREACGPQHAVLTALGSFAADQADEAMESSMALRSLERSVQEILLPALDEVRRRKGESSAAWGFAATWGNDWLRRAQRMTTGVLHHPQILIGDANHADHDVDAAYTRAFALCCSRHGMSVLTLPVCGFDGLGEALAVFAPDIVVVAGDQCGEDDVGRWACSLRSAVVDVPFLLYHRGHGAVAGIRGDILPLAPTDAQQMVTALLGDTSAGAARMLQPPPDAAVGTAIIAQCSACGSTSGSGQRGSSRAGRSRRTPSTAGGRSSTAPA
jgi:MerR family transcriptional regulator, light-induced transcriptional regulator